MLSGYDHRIFGQLCRICAVNSDIAGPEDAKSIRERINAKILGGAEKAGQTLSDEQWPCDSCPACGLIVVKRW